VSNTNNNTNESYSKNCRGDQKKKNIAKNYIVEPQFALTLLPGQKFYNCCDKQFKEYDANSNVKLYIFDIEHRKEKFRQTLIMGEYCAKELIEIYNKINPTTTINLPSNTNLFTQLNNSSTNNIKKSHNNSTYITNTKINSINSLLLKAIYTVIFLHWNGYYVSPKLTKIIRDINDKPNVINDYGIKHFFEKVLPKDKSYFQGNLIQIYNDIKNKFPYIQQNINFQKLIDYYYNNLKVTP